MEVGKRRILVGTSIIATLLVAGPYVYERWIGESPTYPLCVAVMDQVTVGQPRAEAELRIAEAVAAGAGRWEPGPDVLARHPQSRIPVEPWRSPGYTEVTCRRYDPDSAASPQRSILAGLKLWAQMRWNGAFNVTRYELVVADDGVRTVQALDCASALPDTRDCRGHTVLAGR